VTFFLSSAITRSLEIQISNQYHFKNVKTIVLCVFCLLTNEGMTIPHTEITNRCLSHVTVPRKVLTA